MLCSECLCWHGLMLALDRLELSYHTAMVFIPVPQEGKWQGCQEQLVHSVLGVGSWCCCVCSVTGGWPTCILGMLTAVLVTVIINKIVSLSDLECLMQLADLVRHRKKVVGCLTWGSPNQRWHNCPWPVDIQIFGMWVKRLGARQLQVLNWVRSWAVKTRSSLVCLLNACLSSAVDLRWTQS